MRNKVLNAFQAEVIAADRWPILRACGTVLLPSGCEIALQSDGAYLLKGSAADGSDVASSIAVEAWSEADDEAEAEEKWWAACEEAAERTVCES